MTWAEGINIFLSFIVAGLTVVIYRLTNTMARIAEDDKKEKNGHDLSIVLPTALWDNSTKQASIINF